MGKIAIFMVLTILFISCKPSKRYTVIITVEDFNVNGEKENKEVEDFLLQTNDSLAYFDASATYLVYRNSFDLNGYPTSMGRPVNFKVFNEKGTDVKKLLNKNAISFIDAYFEERYQRAKPSIERRKKKMQESLNAR